MSGKRTKTTVKNEKEYSVSDEALFFCASEETAGYDRQKPFSIYYENPQKKTI